MYIAHTTRKKRLSGTKNTTNTNSDTLTHMQIEEAVNKLLPLIISHERLQTEKKAHNE